MTDNLPLRLNYNFFVAILRPLLVIIGFETFTLHSQGVFPIILIITIYKGTKYNKRVVSIPRTKKRNPLKAAVI